VTCVETAFVDTSLLHISHFYSKSLVVVPQFQSTDLCTETDLHMSEIQVFMGNLDKKLQKTFNGKLQFWKLKGKKTPHQHNNKLNGAFDLSFFRKKN